VTVNTVPQRHFVELTNLENQLLKAAFMVLLGAATRDSGVATLGTIGGIAFLQELGEEGMKALLTKMDAHADASAQDGSHKLAVVEG
jgi:hypothetical protein